MGSIVCRFGPISAKLGALYFLSVSVDAYAGARAGAFEVFVFAESWLPTLCQTNGCKSCAASLTPYSERNVIVHGLWPTWQRSYPQYCNGPAGNFSSCQFANSTDPICTAAQDASHWSTISNMACGPWGNPQPCEERMVSYLNPGFANHEWTKHGSCYGYNTVNTTIWVDQIANVTRRTSNMTWYKGLSAAAVKNGSISNDILLSMTDPFTFMGCTVNCSLNQIYTCWNKSADGSPGPQIDCFAYGMAFPDVECIAACPTILLPKSPQCMPVTKLATWQIILIALCAALVCLLCVAFQVTTRVRFAKALEFPWRELHTEREVKILCPTPLPHDGPELVVEELTDEFAERIPESFRPFHTWLKEHPRHGYKGGLARLMAKLAFGLDADTEWMKSEIEGFHDIDMVYFRESDECEDEALQKLVDKYAGTKIAGIEVEAPDIALEHNIPEYFHTRDLTINQLLVVSDDKGKVFLIYTPVARTHSIEGSISPTHASVNAGLSLAFITTSQGAVVPSVSRICRTLIAFAKRRGVKILLDDACWKHYRKHKLDVVALFSVFSKIPDGEFNRVYLYMVSHNLMDRFESPEEMWGDLYKRMNHKLAQYGERLVAGKTLEPDEVLAWKANKETTMARQAQLQLKEAQKTGFALDLGWKLGYRLPCGQGKVVLDLPAVFTEAEGEADSKSIVEFAASALEPRTNATQGSSVSVSAAMPSTLSDLSGTKEKHLIAGDGKTPKNTDGGGPWISNSDDFSASAVKRQLEVKFTLSQVRIKQQSAIKLNQDEVEGKLTGQLERAATLRSASSLSRVASMKFVPAVPGHHERRANDDFEFEDDDSLRMIRSPKLTCCNLVVMLAGTLYVAKGLLALGISMLIISSTGRIVVYAFMPLTAENISILFGVSVVGLLIASWFVDLAAQEVAMRVLTVFMAKVLDSKAVYWQQQRFFAELWSRLVGDSMPLSALVSQQFPVIIQSACEFIFAVGLLDYYIRRAPIRSMQLIYILLVEGAIAMCLSGVFGILLRVFSREVRGNMGRLYGFTFGMLARIPFIQSSCQSKTELAVYEPALHDALSGRRVAMFLQTFAFQLLQTMEFVFIAIFVEGSKTSSSRELGLTLFASRAMIKMCTTWITLMFSIGSLERFFVLAGSRDITEVEPVLNAKEKSQLPSLDLGLLEIRRLRFRFGGFKGPPAVSVPSLLVPGGEVHVLQLPREGGSTTLCQLLLKQWYVVDQIFLGGVCVTHLPRDLIRMNVAIADHTERDWMSNEPVGFSLIDSLLYGSDRSSDLLSEILQKLGLEHRVFKMPGGVESTQWRKIFSKHEQFLVTLIRLLMRRAALNVIVQPTRFLWNRSAAYTLISVILDCKQRIDQERRLQGQRPSTFLFITPDPEEREWLEAVGARTTNPDADDEPNKPVKMQPGGESKQSPSALTQRELSRSPVSDEGKDTIRFHTSRSLATSLAARSSNWDAVELH